MLGKPHNRLFTAGPTAAFLLLTGPILGQGPPINTDTAFVNGLEGAAFRTFVFSVRRSGLASEGQDLVDPLGREVSIYGVPIVFPYEVAKNKLILAAGVPVLHKEMELSENGQRRTLSTSGFGDAFVASKLLLVQRDSQGRTTRFAATGRIKLPTGKDDETDAQGNLLPPPLQLGSGSLDYALGGVFTHARRRVGLNADASYHFRTAAEGFSFGDSLTYNLSLGYRLSPSVYRVYPARNHVNAYIELNGEVSRKNRSQGIDVPDSGGNLIYCSPGIQIIPGGNFLIEASLRLPVVQRLSGVQLEFRPGFNVGMRWLLF